MASLLQVRNEVRAHSPVEDQQVKKRTVVEHNEQFLKLGLEALISHAKF